MASLYGAFRTAPDDDTAISFTLTGGHGSSYHPSRITDHVLAGLMEKEKPDFMVFLGDMVPRGERKFDYYDYVFGPFKCMIATTPFYFVMGNHEYNDYDQNKEYVMNYMKGLFPLPAEKGYFDFDYGCAHFVALDNNLPYDDEAQIQFLINSLKNSKAPWKFVCMHISPYFSGLMEDGGWRVLGKYFEEYGVDAVFSSHVFVYERSHPIKNGKVDYKNGIPYIVVGGAGDIRNEPLLHHKKAWHCAKVRAVSQFVNVTVTPDRFDMQAIDVNGNIFDVYSKEKYK